MLRSINNQQFFGAGVEVGPQFSSTKVNYRLIICPVPLRVVEKFHFLGVQSLDVAELKTHIT